MESSGATGRARAPRPTGRLLVAAVVGAALIATLAVTLWQRGRLTVLWTRELPAPSSSDRHHRSVLTAAGFWDVTRDKIVAVDAAGAVIERSLSPAAGIQALAVSPRGDVAFTSYESPEDAESLGAPVFVQRVDASGKPRFKTRLQQLYDLAGGTERVISEIAAADTLTWVVDQSRNLRRVLVAFDAAGRQKWTVDPCTERPDQCPFALLGGHPTGVVLHVSSPPSLLWYDLEGRQVAQLDMGEKCGGMLTQAQVLEDGSVVARAEGGSGEHDALTRLTPTGCTWSFPLERVAGAPWFWAFAVAGEEILILRGSQGPEPDHLPSPLDLTLQRFSTSGRLLGSRVGLIELGPGQVPAGSPSLAAGGAERLLISWRLTGRGSLVAALK